MVKDSLDPQEIARKKLKENEKIFAKLNERISEASKKFLDYSEEMTNPVDFVCECADINCTEKISIPLKVYKQLTKREKQFIVRKDHEIPQIESIVRDLGNIVVVQKG